MMGRVNIQPESLTPAIYIDALQLEERFLHSAVPYPIDINMDENELETIGWEGPVFNIGDTDLPDFDGGEFTVWIASNGTNDYQSAIVDRGPTVVQIGVINSDVTDNFGGGRPYLAGIRVATMS